MDVQYASPGDAIPPEQQFLIWVSAVLDDAHVQSVDPDAELTLRIVDETEGARLNERFRHRPGATNVLSFPFERPQGIPLPVLGDVVICAPVVEREAAEQSKELNAHWAHMVVHGTLHLLGFTHEHEEEAREMESLETRILSRLGFPNPYIDPQSS